MPITRLISLNGNGGAFTSVPATIPARSVELAEDGSVAAQGLQLRYPGDGFAVTNTVPPGAAVSLTGAGRDGILGLPAQTNRPADVYCQARSATATATTLRVLETESL